MEVSENGGGTPRSSIYKWIFHEPSIMEMPVSHFSKKTPMTGMEKTTLLHSKSPAIFGQTSDLRRL